jgi:hypothetical protein
LSHHEHHDGNHHGGGHHGCPDDPQECNHHVCAALSYTISDEANERSANACDLTAECASHPRRPMAGGLIAHVLMIGCGDA